MNGGQGTERGVRTTVPLTALLSVVGLLAVWSCRPAATEGGEGVRVPVPEERSLAARAQELRSLLTAEDYQTARAMMSPDPRRWWEGREGEGERWRIGPDVRGPWQDWDEHFRSTSTILEWREEPGSATAVVRETNDYFRLLERGYVTNEITYFFDDSSRIDGLLIRAVGERAPGRTDEFLAWAKAEEPEELAALMPGGEIDPSGDHPLRFRRLLVRWREASGLGSIDDPESPVEPGGR